jgi:cytidine deaminase
VKYKPKHGNGKNNINTQFVGRNIPRPRSKIVLHSEVSAMKQLNMKSLYGKTINMLVIRSNNEGKLCSSQPCASCISYMTRMTKKYKFKIGTIHYSNNGGTITKSSLFNLINHTQYHYSLRDRVS